MKLEVEFSLELFSYYCIPTLPSIVMDVYLAMSESDARQWSGEMVLNAIVYSSVRMNLY